MTITLRHFAGTQNRWPTTLCWADGIFYAEISAPGTGAGRHNIGHTTLMEARRIADRLPEYPAQTLLNTIDCEMLALHARREVAS